MDIQTRPDPVARARELGAEIAAASEPAAWLVACVASGALPQIAT